MKEELIKKLLNDISPCKVVAVTKYVDTDVMRKLYHYGIHNFGENKTNSFLEKYNALSDLDITWHFIGHLQRNKVKDVIYYIDCLHSLDSLKLAEMIDKLREKLLDVFVELKLVDNDAKSGIREENLHAFMEEIKKYPKIHVIGFMTMTDKNKDDEAKRLVFKRAMELAKSYGLTKLSMGMSQDYKLALEEGATNVRLGRILYEDSDFKEEYRNYIKKEGNEK